MALISTKQGRERLILYGTTGTSKTHTHLTIARWSARTWKNSPDQPHFHIIDTDSAVLDQIEEEGWDLNNFTVYPAYEYPDYHSAFSQIRKSLRPDDWIIVDMLGEYWEACQRYFSSEIYGQDIENYFILMRREMEKNNQRAKTEKDKQKQFQPFEGWTDWPTINKMNKGFMDTLCLRSTCHILATSKADAINSKTESQTNLDVYERVGFKPQGQKYIGHYFRTIIFTQKLRNTWAMQSVKDRGRSDFNGEVKDFVISYLKGIAGWQI